MDPNREDESLDLDDLPEEEQDLDVDDLDDEILMRWEGDDS